MRLPLRFVAVLALVPGQILPAGSTALPSTPCVAAASLFSAATFRKYPANANWRGPWRKPDVRFGEAHLYRTVVREQGVGPPAFAGHYKVVTHGCGAGMTCPLFLDLKTGKVASVESLRSVEWDYSRADEVGKVSGIEDSRLVYRRDSRLLIALGTRNEDVRLAGATLYEWRDEGPRLVRFIPQDALCAGGAGR